MRKLILTGTGPAGGKGIEEVVWVAQLDTLRGLLSRQDPKPFLFFTRTAKVAPKRRWAVQATRVVHTTGAGDSGVGRSPVGRHRARGSTVARLNNDRPQLCGTPIDGGRDAHCY